MGRFDPIQDVQDLTGKVVIVTGATSGIGYTTAQQLLRKGATVYLAARNEEKAKETIARLESEGVGPGNGKPVFHHLTLDEPRAAKASAEAFLQREVRLDILVNNAAALSKAYEAGELGCEYSMVVNQISPFIFTNTLLPLMKKTAMDSSADVRIVIVSSEAHTYVKGVRFSSRGDLNISYEGESWDMMKRYARTKLANILWGRELAKHLALSRDDGGSNILVVIVHPGGVATEGAYDNIQNMVPKFLSKLVPLLVRILFLTSTEGAYNSTFAAASPKVRREFAKYNGAYLVPGQKFGKATLQALDDNLAKNLWELQERILKEEGI